MKKTVLLLAAVIALSLSAIAQSTTMGIYDGGRGNVFLPIGQIDSITFVTDSMLLQQTDYPVVTDTLTLESQRKQGIDINDDDEESASVFSHLVLIPLSGDDWQYALDLIGNIYFRDKTMYLYDKDSMEIGSTPLAEIGKITFVNNGDNIINEKHQACLVYPNPTHDMLIVRDIEIGQTIHVYSMHGVLIQTIPVHDRETKIDVSHLSNGTYFLQLGAELVKFIKQ